MEDPHKSLLGLVKGSLEGVTFELGAEGRRWPRGQGRLDIPGAGKSKCLEGEGTPSPPPIRGLSLPPTPHDVFLEEQTAHVDEPRTAEGNGADNMVLSQRQIIHAEETEYRFQAHAHTLKATDTWTNARSIAVEKGRTWFLLFCCIAQQYNHNTTYPTPCCCCCSASQPSLILCHRLDCSLPGSFVPRILQARILEWVAFPSPGDLSDLGIEFPSLMSPALACGFFTTSAPGKPPLIISPNKFPDSS